MIAHWVYIFEDKKQNLTIGLTTDIGKKLSFTTEPNRIIYLRSFDDSFDAVAHKHLLDDLSEKTVRAYIKKHKDNTEATLFSLSTTTG